MTEKSGFSQIFFKSIFLFVFGFIFAPCSAYAVGQMTRPIMVDNAMRGQEFEQILTIMNTEEEATEIYFLAENDIEGWVEFFLPENMNNPIIKLDMAAQERRAVIAKFSIPEDKPNGEYKGLLSIKHKAKKSTTTSMVTSQIARKVSRPVTIIVTDIEDINFKATFIPEKYDLLPGEPLKIRVKYANQGNIAIKPQLQIKIVQADKNYYNAILPYPEDEEGVKPLTTYEIAPIDIPVAGVALGKIRAEITVLYNQEAMQEETIKFTVALAKAEKEPVAAKTIPINPNLLAFIAIAFITMAGITVYIKKKPKKNDDMTIKLKK